MVIYTRHRARGLVDLALLKLLVLAVIGANGQVSDLFAEEIVLTSPPNVTMNELPGLTGVLEFSTNVPARVSVRVHGTQEGWLVDSSEPQINHSFPLLGFAPDSHYNVSVTLADENGTTQTLGDFFSVATPPLPSDFPVVEVRTSDVARMEPGYTLVPARARGAGDGNSYAFATDPQGDVRWYVQEQIGLIRRQADGSLLLGANAMREMDMLGNVSRSWHTQSIPSSDGVTIQTERVHHDTFPMSNGNFLSLITESQTIENFPTSDTEANPPRQTAEVVDSPIIEFAPDGTVVQQINPLDVLDQTRIGYDVIQDDGNFWAWGNAVIHDDRDDSVIVSLRHQDALVKLSRSTGDLVWILGNHANWGDEFEEFLLEPVGEIFEWQYHQHAPMLLPNGNLLVHDNGNNRASPPDTPIGSDETYTRAVEYAIDEETMEINQVWEYGRDAKERIFSPTLGDADWLSETDNVLITFGNPRFINGERAEKQVARIVEVERDGEVVYDLAVTYAGDQGATVYRSDRIPALYPPEYTLTQVLLGDFDENGTVAFEDFEILARHFGTMGDYFDGDIDGNGTIQFDDFAIFASNFGRSDPSVAAVPEPSSTLLVAFMAAAVMVRRRHRRILFSGSRRNSDGFQK